MNILLINAIIYILIWGYKYYRLKRFNLYMLLLSAFTINAIMGYWVVENGYYFNPNPNIVESFSFIPYAASLICNLMLCQPFYNINEEKIDITMNTKSRIFSFFIYSMTLLTLLFVLLKASEAYIVSQIGFADAYNLKHENDESLIKYTNPFLILLNGWGGTLVGLVQPILVMFFISRIIQKQRILSSVLFLLMIFSSKVFGSLAIGSKGGLFFCVLGMLFYYILYKNLLPQRIRKVISILGIIFTLILATYALQIAESRNVSSNSDTSSGIIRYLGEAMPNLGYDVYGHVKEHPYGARFFPELFDVPVFENMAERFEYWSKITGITEAWFSTFWGDCYVEFGFIGSFVFIYLFILIWKKMVFRKYHKNYILPLVNYYYGTIVLMGIFDYNFYEPRTHKLFIFLIIVCWYFYKLQEINKSTMHLNSKYGLINYNNKLS